MFSKLQLYLLAGCAFIAAVGFAVCGFHTNTSSEQVVASAPYAPADSAPGTFQPASESKAPPVPKPMPIQTSPSIITNGNEADEKIIDAAMAQVVTAFKRGEYSVAVDVMYTPVLQACGGREKVMETLNA